MIQLDFSSVELRVRKLTGTTQVFDPIRKKWVAFTPEEHVRQYILQYLIIAMKYPKGLIAVEKQVLIRNIRKRFDIVVYNREHQPWMLVECKAPEVDITDNVLRQLLQYHEQLQCSYWLVTNGRETYCADACDVTDIKWLDKLPAGHF